MVYSIMFAPETPTLLQVEEFIALVRSEPHYAQIPLPARGEAMGGMMIFKYQTSVEKLKETMLTKQKAAIYKSTILDYSTTLTDQQLQTLWQQDTFVVRFTSKYKIYGKYGTQFSYAMQTSLIKQPQWIWNGNGRLGQRSGIKGLGGYLKDLCYTILLVETGPHSALRIAASWSDAGGDIPVIGKITPSYENIYEGIIQGYQDVLDYFQLPAWHN